MEITSKTKLIGLIGHPIEHSLSPLIQNHLVKETGLDMRYLAFDVPKEQLEKAVFGLRALGAVGFNVTIPHKVNIISYLDRLSEEARLIGAVNTVVLKEDKLIGHNTDGRGFTKSMGEEGIEIVGKTIAFLGAGGAVRAAAFQSALEGVGQIVIINRDVNRARQLCQNLQDEFNSLNLDYLSLEEFLAKKRSVDYDILVNATPLGTYPNTDKSILEDTDLFIQGKVAYDMVYNPTHTRFLKIAQDRGMGTLSGIDMLINQGLLSYELWTAKLVEKKTIKNLLYLKEN